MAAATGATYVPVFEREATWLPGALAARGWPARAYDGNPRTSLRLGLTGCMLHYLLGQSFSTIAARRGMLLKTDYLHGTEAEAEIIATALAPVLEGAPLPA